MPGPGANPDGTAFFSHIIGDAAQMANIHPAGDFPVTADYSVTNVTELNNALALASAGETIELATGSYGTWYPQKINVTNEANHDTNKIRIFCRTWCGATTTPTSANSAVFANIEPDNTPGCSGLSIENVRLADFRAEGANIGFIDLVGCWAELWRLTYSTGRMRALHCVFDHEFKQSDGNGSTSNMNFLDAHVYLQNVIFCRAGGDNVQIQQTDTNGKVFLHDFAIWDQYVNNATAHPDLFQTVSGRAVDIRRGILWQQRNVSGNKGAQGIALGDGIHSDVTIENVFVNCDLARKISGTSMTGEISEAVTIGQLYASETFGAGAVYVHDTITSAIAEENGDPFTVDPDLPAQNNTQYGGADPATLLQNGSGDYRTWRDYLPVTSRDNGGIAYLNSLEAIWDGAMEMPSDGLVTISTTVG